MPPTRPLKFPTPQPATVTGADANSPRPVPRHVAVVMDGNGRWARKRGLPRIAGHRRGVEVVKNLAPMFVRRGIPHLTLFAFSSENWQRPSTEVALLLDLLAGALENETRLLMEHCIRLRVIGDLSPFPKRLQRNIAAAIARTDAHRALNLTVAVNYGGKWDIARACAALAEQVAQQKITAAQITPAMLAAQLCTNDLPEPDLFIRTGGEQRISNFLLWQLAYTELYFTDVFWPDFGEADVDDALDAFAHRQRRFGKTQSQVDETVMDTVADDGDRVRELQA